MTAIPLILFLLLFASPQAAKTENKEPEPPLPPKPSVAISFERSNIREQDTVPLTLIVTNDADADLTNTSLEIHSPLFLSWRLMSCNGQVFNPAKEIKNGAALLVPVKARSTLKCDLLLTSQASISIGEFNTLFLVGYQRQVGKNTDSSIITTEKTVKANLLGSDSVAGVPLVLAGFVIPGLIFWVIVDWFNLPWKREGLGDQMIYSVLISLVLVGVETWIGLINLNDGISTSKLLWLGLGGFIAGGIAVLVDRNVRRIKESRTLSDQINEGDDELTILGKLLSLPALATVAQPMIELKSGERYVGSLAARTEMIRRGSADKTALYSLVGSWQINLPTEGTPLRAEIDRLRDAKKIRQLIETARSNNLITAVDSLQSVDKNNNLAASNIRGTSWRADDVTGITPNVQGWGSPPLDLK